LIDGGMAFDSQPKFSPDGQWIAFLSDREGSENVWIMHEDGSGVKQVSKDPNSEFASPSWDPSGKYVYVSKTHFGIGPREIWMYHVDGGAGIQITKAKPTPTTKREDRTSVMGVVASADGKYLYYAERRRDFSYNSMFRCGRSNAKIARPAKKTRSLSSHAVPCGRFFRRTENFSFM